MATKKWESEPKIEVYNIRGFLAVIMRHERLLHLCGYINIPEEYASKVNPNEYAGYEHEVHGGCTYDDPCPCDQEVIEDFLVVNTEEVKKPSKRWLGFDCAHGGDYIPGMPNSFIHPRNEDAYKDWEFVKKELENWVDQIAPRLLESK